MPGRTVYRSSTMPRPGSSGGYWTGWSWGTMSGISWNRSTARRPSATGPGCPSTTSVTSSPASRREPMRQALETVDTVTDLAAFYAQPPEGVRANMIFSADGAAAFAGRARPLSNAVDQQLLRILRGFADVVLVGAGTARAENYGPVRLSEERRAQRRAEGRSDTPPIAVVTRSGNLPSRLADNPDQPPILVTCGHPRSVEDHRADPDRRVFHA